VYDPRNGRDWEQRAVEATSKKIKDRIKELRRVRARELVPNSRNWRVHPTAQARALRALLTNIGYASALIARELPDGRLQLIDGHLRAETTPNATVPVLVLDVSEQEADKLLLTLDPLAAMAESDAEKLKALLEVVRTDDEAVRELLKRTAGDRLWETLYPQEIDEAEVSLERADELKAKWRAERGQVWRCEPHRLICGDSTDQAVLARLWGDADLRARMLFADAPYGVNYGEKTQWTNRRRGGPKRRSIENDSLKPTELQKLFAAALNVAREYALPGAAIYATVPGVFLKYFIQGLEDGGFSYRHCLIWVKQSFVLGRSDYHYRHEPILYGWLDDGPHYFTEDRTQDSVFEVNRPMVSDLHPTTKPVELIARMVANSSRPRELVYDPFAGSGSTLLAAHQLGRVGYGCEVDPAYVAVTLERLSMLGLKPKLVK
jgi:DNA modification methylase